MALAGATYFEGYLLDQSHLDDLNKAIIDYGRARQLAAEAFDSLLEQYCCAMLALMWLTRGEANDIVRTKELRDEIEKWPSLSQATRILKMLIKVLFVIVGGGRASELEPGAEALHEIEKCLEQWDGGGREGDGVAEDNNSALPNKGQLCVFRRLVEFRLDRAKYLPRRSTASA